MPGTYTHQAQHQSQSPPAPAARDIVMPRYVHAPGTTPVSPDSSATPRSALPPPLPPSFSLQQASSESAKISTKSRLKPQMPPRHRSSSNPAQLAFRAAVIIGLGAEFGNQATWSASQGMPFITNLPALAASPAFRACAPDDILCNLSAKTTLEAADGNWAGVAASLPPRPAACVADLTAAFNQHIWPSRSQASTRAKHWANWAVVVTWAIAWGAAHLILPMNTDTLKGLSWELLCMGTSRSVITAIWAAVQHRHRTAGLPPPISGLGEFSAWTRCLAGLVGRPTALLFPVHRLLVAAMLRARPDAARDNRDRLMVALATICCLRVAELIALQVCDLWFDFHTGYGIPGFRGTAAVHVARRKNDCERKGHHPAIGRSKDPALDLVHQLRLWLRSYGISVSPLCQKGANPSARCPHCPPLFSRFRNGPACRAVSSTDPLSTQMFADALRRVMGACGADTSRFSGISARKGGLTTAISAGVTEEILFLQSGHSQSRAARNYMHLQDPHRLFDTFRAFGL